MPIRPATNLPATNPPDTSPGAPIVSIRRGDPSRQVVALTFDAGSDVGYAAEILDVLQANGIKATFGITGRWTEDHPELVQRMAREGHQLLNHTYDHDSFTGVSTRKAPLSSDQRIDELARAEAAIQAASGTSTAPWWRPPYGDDNDAARADAAAAGYPYEAMWTLDSLGWMGTSADAIVDRCLSGAENGAIYLFHVGSASADAAALQRIIDGLRQAGYDFTTVAGMV
ncbi:MAG: polysaccharide deacetylase family protein [Acidimicrobiales bacterium]